MNLGDYISGYLDGDLTPEQDAELRAIISDDPSAREEFEHAALVGATMMSDADNIVVPDDIFNETESLIMGLMHEESQRKAAMQMRPARERFYRLVAVAMFAMLYFVADSVHIFNGGEQASLISGKNTAVVSLDDKSQPAVDPKLVGKRVVKRTDNVEPVASQVGVVSQPNVAAVVRPIPEQNPDLAPIKFPPVAYNPLIIPTPAGTESKNVTGATLPTASSTMPATFAGIINTPSTMSGVNRSVQFSTFVGNIVSGGGDKKVGTQHYSQSLGYAVTSSDNIGVEVGYMAYSGTVSAGSLSSNTIATGYNRGGVEGAPDGEMDNSASGKEVTSRWVQRSNEQEKSVYWGAAFYERAVMSYDAIQLNTRVGVGSSSDGPILFGRGFARIKVYGNFSLTAGAEGRMFIMTNEGNQSAPNNIQTVLSTVYGVQVRF